MGDRQANYSYILRHNTKEGTDKKCLRGWYIFRERNQVAGDNWKNWKPHKYQHHGKHGAKNGNRHTH